METQKNTVQTRNVQLDFFRGIALMIIFINHIPFNELSFYTPSRFGLSDAAETFVYLSGFAAAIAYGRCFPRAGIGLGTARILHRCGQIYASHLALFFLLAAICVIGNVWMAGTDYIQRLYIQYFFDHTQEAVLGLFTLRYVPNFFDILPMYLVIMLWVPVVWALSRLHFTLALGFSVAVYSGMWLFGWELPADPVSERPWYFNPFAWQLMFFTGFAFGAGWLRVPHLSRGLVALCLSILLVAMPLGHEPTYAHVELLTALRLQLEPLLDKSHLGLLRWVHFLALAYLMNHLFKWKEHWLDMTLPRWITKMGQQSLGIFLFCMSLSYIGGMVLDWTGRDAFSIAWVNIAGLGLMLSAAQALAWLDSQPWKRAAGYGAPAGHLPRLPAQEPAPEGRSFFPSPFAQRWPAPHEGRDHTVPQAPCARYGVVQCLPILGAIPRVWPRQAAVLSLLLSLTAAPFLFLHEGTKAGTAGSAITAGLPNDRDGIRADGFVPPSESEDLIEWQDGV